MSVKKCTVNNVEYFEYETVTLSDGRKGQIQAFQGRGARRQVLMDFTVGPMIWMNISKLNGAV